MQPFKLKRLHAYFLDEVLNDAFEKGRDRQSEIYLEEVLVDKMMKDFVISGDDLGGLIFALGSYKSKVNPTPYEFDGTFIKTNEYTFAFLQSGGFMALYEQELKELKFSEQIQQVNDSVIATNQSIRRVNKLFWATLIFAMIGALFQGLTFWKELQQDKQQKQQQLQNSKPLQQQTLPDSLTN